MRLVLAVLVPFLCVAADVNLRSSWVSDSDLLKIASMRDVRVLDLSHTRVTDIGFQQLKPLKTVTKVNLYYAEQIGDGALAAMREWKQLREVNLRGTKVTDAGLAHLAGLPIESLDVGFSLFTDGGFDHFVNLPQLKKLAVGGNKVTDAGLNSLRLIPNLVELDVSGVQRTDSGLWSATVTDRALETLNVLTKLEVLNLRGGKFTDVGFVKLDGLKSLRQLDIGETELSAKGLAALGNFPKLQTLNLYGAERVTDDAIPVLAGLKTLRWVELTGSGVTAAGVEQLKAANPASVILWDPASKQKSRKSHDSQ